MRARSFPNDFILKIHRSKNPIQQHPQIMTRRWVAMEIEASGRFEDAMQFDQTRRHHRQIRHHRRGPQKAVQGLHHVHNGGVRTCVNKIVKGLGGVGPIPGVGEGVKLRLARLAGGLAEQHIVIRVGIERRVEINQINAGVGKNLPFAQPIQIVAEKEAVHADADYQKAPPGSRVYAQIANLMNGKIAC